MVFCELLRMRSNKVMSARSRKKVGAIKTSTLDVNNIGELIRFNKRVKYFINRTDIISERIRKFVAHNFEIEDLF